jgi:hypothetical protein
MIEKEFIPYELALELKQLGFDEPCFAFYDESLYFPNNENQYGTFCNQKLDASSCSAPTYSQAFRWFRDKYGLCIVIKPIDDKKLDLGYNLLKNGLIMNAHLTYEGAELACLRNLIKIVKTYGGDQQ